MIINDGQWHRLTIERIDRKVDKHLQMMIKVTLVSFSYDLSGIILNNPLFHYLTGGRVKRISSLVQN